MTNLTISRFQSTTAGSRPDEAHTKQWDAIEGDYNFKDLIQAHSDHVRNSGETHYFSFSRWADEHSQWGHEGTTCITLAYDPEAAELVRRVLIESTIAHYEFPIKAGRSKAVMFALPTKDPFDHTQTFRVASLLADMIGVVGLVENSYQSTYFFRFQPGAQVEQRGEQMLNEDVLAENAFVQIKKWVKR